MNVLTELKNRGLQDILITCVDGLKGFPDAIAALYPQAEIQLCIVHMVRNSLRYVSWKERKAVARDLRSIYAAPTAEAAGTVLEEFGRKWDSRFPSISQSWRSRWDNVIPFFAYPPETRKVIYIHLGLHQIEILTQAFRRALRRPPNPPRTLWHGSGWPRA